ncbi:MAG TPA: glycoside hydrolase family 2 TIM barrel-domain containing protein [Thermoleophilaceae bacterium]|nr:glycoside hydrolase family 2 TIM barrel-domain containing protein [Thermoleophilaceae bacterium]
MRRRPAIAICAWLLASACAAAPAAGAPPPAQTLTQGWEVRVEAAAPAPRQPPPPEETAPGAAAPTSAATPAGPAAQGDGEWRPARVPGVFDTRALPSLYPGQVRRYRLRFTGPTTPPGYRWLLRFESVRRNAAVLLNGRRIGRNVDPYTPFTLEARGLRPERPNELVVVVDGRKDPQLPEGWWNWAGIVRPVHLIPAAAAHLHGLGTMSRVECRGAATRCKAALVIDGLLERRRPRSSPLALEVRLRAPGGRIVRGRFPIAPGGPGERRVGFELRVPAPQLWSPERPRLYRARIALRDGGRIVQVERRAIGLRSVSVDDGKLYLNNRRVQLRGASIHEDMPGSGAALSRSDMDRIVADLKELGANVTRAHYLIREDLLERFDRAGILVWSQAPIWQRDAGAHVLWRPKGLRRALLSVRRTVAEARNHPSVLTHSVANELSFTPDEKPGTARFLHEAQAIARDLDPTLPISLDIKGRPGYGEQFSYGEFDLIGLNQYFGWYSWVADFSLLEPYIQELRDHYPRHAIVMTEWGAEGRPELATAALELRGGYPFQAFHAQRTLDVIDRSPVLSGAIYWTLREFEIYPGWTGGAGRRPPQYEPNTRHHKGLIDYEGLRKPAFHLLAERFRATPLYP